jgi:hypothetical protein
MGRRCFQVASFPSAIFPSVNLPSASRQPTIKGRVVKIRPSRLPSSPSGPSPLENMVLQMPFLVRFGLLTGPSGRTQYAQVLNDDDVNDTKLQEGWTHRVGTGYALAVMRGDDGYDMITIVGSSFAAIPLRYLDIDARSLRAFRQLIDVNIKESSP